MTEDMEGRAALTLKRLATVAVTLGSGVALLALGTAAVYAPVGEYDWRLLTFLLTLGVVVGAAVWTLPHVALLRWLGQEGVVAWRGVALGAVATAVASWAWGRVLPATESWWPAAFLLVSLALPLVELVLVAMLWGSHRRRAAASRH